MMGLAVEFGDRKRARKSYRGLLGALKRATGSKGTRLLVAVAVIVLLLMAIVFSRSRAGIMLAALGVAITTITAAPRIGGPRAYGVMGFVLAVVVGFAAAIGLIPVIDRFSATETLGDDRWPMILAAIEMAGRYFPVGAGMARSRACIRHSSRRKSGAGASWRTMTISNGWRSGLLARWPSACVRAFRDAPGTLRASRRNIASTTAGRPAIAVLLMRCTASSIQPAHSGQCDRLCLACRGAARAASTVQLHERPKAGRTTSRSPRYRCAVPALDPKGAERVRAGGRRRSRNSADTTNAGALPTALPAPSADPTAALRDPGRTGRHIRVRKESSA